MQLMSNTIWVHYREDGSIFTIAGEQEPGYRYFAIETFLVEKFLTGEKRIANYDIEYFFNISKGLDVEDEIATIQKSEALLYLIPISNLDNTEITVEHDISNSKWTISSRPGIRDKLDIMPILNFFVCKRDDPHYLYTYFSVTPDDLKVGPVEVPFTIDEEHLLDQISLATQIKFKSYRIKEVK